MSNELPPKLCPKIILEGTRLTHKTETAFRLNEHPGIVGPKKYKYHSPIISAEWCSFTNFPWGRGMINFEPAEAELAMETYSTWVHLFELQKYYSWIIDRFHISTMVYQTAQGRNYDFTWLEDRLLRLGFGIVLLTRKPESFEEARSQRVKVSGKPDQYDNLKILVEDQMRFRKLVAKSLLPHCEIDISDGNIDRVSDEIAEWLREKRLLGYYEK